MTAEVDGDASLKTGGGVSITASGNMTIAGDVSITGKLTASGDVTAGGISLQNHTHLYNPGPGGPTPTQREASKESFTILKYKPR